MSEPTNRELLTHIMYIKAAVDELKETARLTDDVVSKHETRLTVIETQVPRKSGIWGSLGGLVGGFVSGLLSGRLNG